MWAQLIERGGFVGGWLVDYGDAQDRVIIGNYPLVTRITSLELRENGRRHDRFFEVRGEEFSCGGSTEFLGVTGDPEFPCSEGGLALLNTYGGHEFHILPPSATPPEKGAAL